MATVVVISVAYADFNVVNAVMAILLLTRRMEFRSCNTTKVSTCQLTGSPQYFHLGNNVR